MKWFKHFTRAHEDRAVEKLIHEFGIKGYGLYFYCLEIIAGSLDKGNYSFELEPDSEILARRLSMDTLEVEKIMHKCITLGLFEMADSGRLMCMKLANKLDDSTTKNPEIRDIIVQAREYGKIKSTKQYVYIFQDGEKYKIGKTKNISRRFADAKTMNHNITLYHFIETVDSALMEAKLHRYFNSKNIEGEWFSLNNKDLDFICSINQIKDIPDDVRNGSEQIRLDKIRLDKNNIYMPNEKIKHMDHVLLTKEEYKELTDNYEETDIQPKIAYLNCEIANKNSKYVYHESHFAVLTKWLVTDVMAGKIKKKVKRVFCPACAEVGIEQDITGKCFCIKCDERKRQEEDIKVD